MDGAPISNDETKFEITKEAAAEYETQIMPILSSSTQKIKQMRLKHLSAISRNLMNDSRKSMSTLALQSDSSRKDFGTDSN